MTLYKKGIDFFLYLFHILINWNFFGLSRDYFCGFNINPRGLGVGSVLVSRGLLLA